MTITYGSVCSGIEAATAAWHRLGWQAAWLAEIEPFPSAVLAYHYPSTPNLGDMTTIADKILAGEIAAPDILTGGTPCQAFSVAGLRKGLSDARGQLSLEFCRLAGAIDFFRSTRGQPPAVVVWENVPGVLSDKGNAFGCFLAGLAGEDDPLLPPGGKWANAGRVLGPTRAVAWRILDAQYFGVAQRRRRVWVVASARTGFDPAAVLFEFEGVRRDSAPSREAGERTAGGAARSVALRGREGGGTAELGDEVSGCLRASSGGGDKPHVLSFGGNNTGGPIPVAPALNANRGCHNPGDFEAGALIATFQHSSMKGKGTIGYDESSIVKPVKTQMDGQMVCVTGDRTHALKAEGADGSEDGTGRGTPIVAFHPTQDPISNTDGTTHALGCGSSSGQASVAIAHVEVMPTMTAGGPSDTSHHQISGQMRDAYMVPVAVAFQPRHYSDRERMGGEPSDICHTLSAAAGQGDSSPHVATAMQVRRLTPVECERLQGFPDRFTEIPWRKKPASDCPDGPRYKALGNSWAVPCAAWIGRRIHAFIGAPANDNGPTPANDNAPPPDNPAA